MNLGKNNFLKNRTTPDWYYLLSFDESFPTKFNLESKSVWLFGRAVRDKNSIGERKVTKDIVCNEQACNEKRNKGE